MRNTTKLLPILLLGSALGGCSMAGTGDFHTDIHGQQSQYWGATSSCQQQPQQVQYQPTACEQAYASAPQAVNSYPYSAPAYSAPAPQAYASAQQAVNSYPYSAPAYSAPAPQAYASAPQAVNSYPYSAPAYSAPAPQAYAQAVPQQQLYTGQQGYTGQNVYQAPQGVAGYHQGYPQWTGYAPAYVNPYGSSSRGLRQAYTYGSLGATMYDVDSELFGAQARLGYQSKSIFGAELEGSVGFTDENTLIDFGSGLVDSDFTVDTQIAAFAVARYPVSKKLNLLGRVGYHNTELNAEFDDGVTEFETDFSTDGIAYGVGVEYALGQRTAVRADYTVYDFDGPDADAISLAIARKF